MRNSELAHYKSFDRKEDAGLYVNILKENGIPYSLDTPQTLIDEVIVGTSSMIPEVVLKIHSSDFEKVNHLVKQQFESSEISLEGDYLNQLDSDELMDVIKNPDEWSIENGVVARKLLNERGIQISDDDIKNMRKERLEAVRKGKKASPIWMVFYLICIVFGFYLSPIFIVAGIGMGYYYAYGKSTDTSGEKYFVYDTSTRSYGRYMLYGGVIAIGIQLVLWYFYLV